MSDLSSSIKFFQEEASVQGGDGPTGACEASPSTPSSSLARLLLFSVVLAVVVCAVVWPAHADENALPVLGNEKTYSALVLVAAAHCPDPPAHLPSVEFRVEISDFESSNDPILPEILESKDVRVELTVFRGGLKRGDSQSYPLELLQDGPVAPDMTGPENLTTPTMIPNLQPAVVHFARALVLVADGWVPTETIKFITPVCPVDGLDRQEVMP